MSMPKDPAKQEAYRLKASLRAKKEVKIVRKSNGCLEVISHATDTAGYPLGWEHGKHKLMHRQVYEKNFGEIPKGFHVLHKCDNRRCINPQHLFLGTNADNVRDRNNKSRQACGERHGKSKLSEKQVLEIYYSKLSRRILARMFGVHYSTIRVIQRGENWKEVTKKIL